MSMSNVRKTRVGHLGGRQDPVAHITITHDLDTGPFIDGSRNVQGLFKGTLNADSGLPADAVALAIRVTLGIWRYRSPKTGVWRQLQGGDLSP